MKKIFIILSLLMLGNIYAQDMDKTRALNLIQANAKRFHIVINDNETPLVTNAYTDEQTGLSFIYFQQTYKGIKVYNQIQTLAFKNGQPFLSFAVQGGDTQEQNLLQFFLNMVEFNMTVQQACEAANINSNQLWLSLGGTKIEDRKPRPGNLLLNTKTPEAIRNELKKMGYTLTFDERSSGPINAIYFDWKNGSFWGGSSNNGEDYGIGW